MVIERLCKRLVSTPWGVSDLRPWHDTASGGELTGEIRFELPSASEKEPQLLLKLLFTSQPLSIQVHPDDTFAQAMGKANGKSEAWYVLSAASDATIALGLTDQKTAEQVRSFAQNGSLTHMLSWRKVLPGDAICVPSRTIHALGAGLVVAEIQQRSDTTYRLFDYGRPRELHIDQALAVAELGPSPLSPPQRSLTAERTLLANCPHFSFERIKLDADTTWRLEALRETWILIVAGNADIGGFALAQSDAIFVEADDVDIRSGASGVTALVAYAGGDVTPGLLQKPRATSAATRIRGLAQREKAR